MNQSDEVMKAAQDLVAFFGANLVKQYFACFSPDADFIFYTHTERLTSRSAYEELWKTWELENGFKVIGCQSSSQNVKILDSNNAVFTHNVTTQVSTNDGIDSILERETIIFSLIDGRWLAVHEHLSPQSI